MRLLSAYVRVDGTAVKKRAATNEATNEAARWRFGGRRKEVEIIAGHTQRDTRLRPSVLGLDF
jgi:hypothetical protein